MKRWICAVILLGCYAGASVCPADAARAPIELTMTIPEDDAGSDISNPDFHFVVIIKNVSRHPVTIWKRWCSLGAFNIQFYLDSEDGKMFSPPKLIPACDLVLTWSRNFPDPLTLAPGEIDVRDFYVGKQVTFHPGPVNAPHDDTLTYGVPKGHKVSIHVEYLVPKADPKQGIWTGKADSAVVDFDLMSTSRSDYFPLTIEYSPFYSPAYDLMLKNTQPNIQGGNK